jgi:glycerophosphoryl diester phosphodiesterase
MGGGADKWGIVERAIRYDCKKVQLVKGYFDQSMIDRAHENGIRCNVFWSDEPEEARRFLNMGIDVILTNNYNEISQLI